MIRLGDRVDGGAFEINLPRLIESRLLIQAGSGGGKSYLLRKLLEATHGSVQQIVLDVEGEFASLRTKFDYILAGKGGDVPADPKTAELLARKLLELGSSCIIDLYELPPPARSRYVKLFCEAMVRAPKELWHPVLVVVDEAHLFAPEKGKSEALEAVVNLTTLGRKREFAVVLATQRISKLHKDAAAECHNKLIGLAGLDIDMKRAADELGFTQRDQVLSLRDLDPGEFFAFGPAISRAIAKVQIGEVKTPHGKAARKLLTHVPAPTAKVKQVLSKLADLPKQAEEEIRDRDSMMRRIRELEQQLKASLAKPDQKLIDQAKQETRRDMIQDFKKRVQKLNFDISNAIAPIVQNVVNGVDLTQVVKITICPPNSTELAKAVSKMPPGKIVSIPAHCPPLLESHLSKAARAILNVLMAKFPDPLTKAQLAGWTQYSITSSTFANALSELRGAGWLQSSGDECRYAGNPGDLDTAIAALGSDYNPKVDLSLDGWSSKLSKAARTMLDYIREQGRSVPKEELESATGYSITSSTFANAVSELCTKKLCERTPEGIRINPELA